MMATIEISMYPLKENYAAPILAFIDRLKENHNIEVRVNETSTHLFGPYDQLMDLMKNELKATFEEEPTVVVVMKVINNDLRGIV